MQSVGYFNYCLNIYWSLSVEEVFYVFFPLVCLLIKKRYVFIGVGCVLLALGPWYRAQHSDNELFFMYGYFACFDAIALGCLTALAVTYSESSLSLWCGKWLRLPAVIGLIAVYLLGIHGHEVWGVTGIALATSILLFGADYPLAAVSLRISALGIWRIRVCVLNVFEAFGL